MCNPAGTHRKQKAQQAEDRKQQHEHANHPMPDHSRLPADPALMQRLVSMPIKGGGKAARRGKYSSLLAGGGAPPP